MMNLILAIFGIGFALIIIFFNGRPWFVSTKKMTKALITYAVMRGGENIQVNWCHKRNNFGIQHALFNLKFQNIGGHTISILCSRNWKGQIVQFEDLNAFLQMFPGQVLVDRKLNLSRSMIENTYIPSKAEQLDALNSFSPWVRILTLKQMKQMERLPEVVLQKVEEMAQFDEHPDVRTTAFILRRKFP